MELNQQTQAVLHDYTRLCKLTAHCYYNWVIKQYSTHEYSMLLHLRFTYDMETAAQHILPLM